MLCLPAVGVRRCRAGSALPGGGPRSAAGGPTPRHARRGQAFRGSDGSRAACTDAGAVGAVRFLGGEPRGCCKKRAGCCGAFRHLGRSGQALRDPSVRVLFICWARVCRQASTSRLACFARSGTESPTATCCMHARHLHPIHRGSVSGCCNTSEHLCAFTCALRSPTQRLLCTPAATGHTLQHTASKMQCLLARRSLPSQPRAAPACTGGPHVAAAKTDWSPQCCLSSRRAARLVRRR